MKNNITELVFILDQSGSMQHLCSDTIGGFNSLIEKQKSESGECKVTTVLFDTRIKMLHDRTPLEQVQPMTGRDYVPGGCTALLDAVGSTVRHIASVHRYARPEDVPENTLFVITTDGLENASRQYSRQEVKRMIEHEKEKYGWHFLFLGANIDAFDAADGIGISRDFTTNFMADRGGVSKGFRAVESAVCAARCQKPVPKAWKKEVEEDYNSRNGNA